MSPKHLNNSLNEMLQIDNINDVKCEMSRDNNDDVSKSKIEYQIIEVNDMKNTQIIELPNTVYSSNNNKNNLNFKLNEKIRLNNVNNKSPITMININLPQTQQKQQQQQSSQRYQQLLTFSTDKCKKCDKHDYQSNDNNNDVNSDITSIPIQKKMEKDKSFSHIRNSPFLTTSSFSSSCSFKPNNNNRHRKSIITQKTNITEQQNEPLTNNIERELRREEILSVLIPKHDINTKLAHATIGENKQQGTIATTTQQITIPIPITTITMTIARTSVAATATTTSTTTIANNVLSTLTNDITIFNENKYVCNSWYQLSNQKCLEANGSLVALTPINQFNINNTNNQQQTLAERKALLKQAFFLGFPSINATDQTSIPKREQSDIRIEKDYKEESLVAQRTRHLNEKIVKPSTFKDNVNNSALPIFGYKEFPQIKELVKKFDTASLIPKTSKTLRKATTKQIDTLKKKENMLQEQQPQPRQQQEKEKQQKQLQRHQQKQRQSPLSDEGCNLGHSPYSTDDDDQEIAQDDDNVSVRATQTIIENIDNKIDKMEKIPLKEKVSRSGSSDSALGLEIEEAMDAFPPPKEKQQKRRMTLTVTDIPLRPALLPLAEPTLLPDSPTLEVPLSPTITTTTTSAMGASLATATKSLIGANVPPSKILLPERVVSIPEEPRHLRSASNSRRESCFSDIIGKDQEISGVRYVRTPSVVISDYSDDALCGITLEEIEYFRAQRMRHRRSSLDTTNTIDKDDNNSDFSNASSCSNLYYCGSTISALDGNECLVNGERLELQRNISNCSSTGSLSGQDDEEDDANIHSIPEQPESEPQPETDMVDLADILSNQHLNNTRRSKKPSGWRKIRNIVQWTPFFQTYKKQRYPWVQLAGHQGNFKAGPEQGTVLKKLCPKEENCFQVLMKDVLRPYVPEYKGQVTSEDGELYLQLQDLLSDFHQPCVMDCKIGVRTYLEEELSKAKEKPKLRKDMYEKMIQIDPNAPSDEEHRAKGVTKPRYMVWRETISSTATLGFRIEGIKKSDGTSSKDFKTTKSREQIKLAFREFLDGFSHALPRYLQRLRAIRATLECSDFFRQHEVIGSSLLFVHDRKLASVWLIDFAKTIVLPDNHQIDHCTTWKVGNHEDGYLIGINNLIEIFQELEDESNAVQLMQLEFPSQSVTSSSTTASSPESLSPQRQLSAFSNIEEWNVLKNDNLFQGQQQQQTQQQQKCQQEGKDKLCGNDKIVEYGISTLTIDHIRGYSICGKRAEVEYKFQEAFQETTAASTKEPCNDSFGGGSLSKGIEETQKDGGTILKKEQKRYRVVYEREIQEGD